MTIYRSGLRGNYGLCGTKKHGFRTKKHEKARKMRQKTDAFAFGTKIRGSSILPTPTKLVLYAQKISPFRKIRTDFLSILYNSLSHQKATVFCPNAMFRHKTPVLSIYYVRFLKISFSLLSAMQFLRSDGGNLGGNGAIMSVGANPIYLTLTLTFITFVSVIIKYHLPFALT